MTSEAFFLLFSILLLNKLHFLINYKVIIYILFYCSFQKIDNKLLFFFENILSKDYSFSNQVILYKLIIANASQAWSPWWVTTLLAQPPYPITRIASRQHRIPRIWRSLPRTAVEVRFIYQWKQHHYRSDRRLWSSTQLQTTFYVPLEGEAQYHHRRTFLIIIDFTIGRRLLRLKFKTPVVSLQHF
jgi:hypothetical protein